ncbi:hypothetical protein [Methylomagnum ishizawai]|uniref:hypothetical protein n=1 Tax=Methylomagnum ishizawai TaxID=1760988 RepID=UPI001C342563|nr:hypothetical protein [Methylomagnum ishizawai]BBL73697.1 hypothetical protein MishRS11D_07950 [Methylomagnum ishizawai]
MDQQPTLKNIEVNALIQELLLKCNRLADQNRMNDGLSLLQEFTAAHGEHPVILRAMARTYMLLGQPQVAAELLKQVLGIIGGDKKSSGSPTKLDMKKKPIQAELNHTHQIDHISEVDVEIIENVQSEIRLGRKYYNNEDAENLTSDGSSLDDSEIIAEHFDVEDETEQSPFISTDTTQSSESEISYEIIGAQSSDQKDKVLTQEALKEPSGSLVDAYNRCSNDLSYEENESEKEELYSNEELEDAEDVIDASWLEEYILEEASSTVKASNEYLWEQFEPIGSDFDEYISSSDFLDVRSDSKLSKIERAHQIAIQVGLEYGWDEVGIQLLTKVFYRYWWSATQVSMRRELASGLVPIELDLAEQAREIWYQYPEFSEEYRWPGEMIQKYRYLPWPSALALIRSFGGYPEIEEVEKLLIDIYEHWRDCMLFMDKFPSFRFYLDYRLGRSRDSLQEAPWVDFEFNDYLDYCGELHDGSDSGTLHERIIQEKLLSFGIDIETKAINRVRLVKYVDKEQTSNKELKKPRTKQR